MSWLHLTPTSLLPGDGPYALAAGGHDLVALRTRGEIRVYEGRCPHQGALLGEGELEGDTIVCRNHRWRFDAATGQRRGGPECLRACPTQVRDGALWVDTSPLDAKAATKARRRIEDLPRPPGIPVLGNTLQIEVPRLHLILEEWARRHGPIFAARFPGKWLIGLSDPELIEEVLRARPETYRRDERVEPVFEELGVGGVFSAEGGAWRRQRKLAMEALAQKNLRGFYPTLAAVAERLRDRWTAAAARGAPVDIQDDLMRFTVDVTTQLVFGRDLDTLGRGDDVIQRHLELVFPTFARRLNAVIPYWRLVRLPVDRRVERAIAALRDWLRDLITETRAALANAPDRPPANFLESMLAARDEADKPFSDEVIFGNAMQMLLAGEDTTANSLAWAVHLLCERPDEVAAFRKELDSVLEGRPVPPTLEAAGRLDYANAIANEAMRLLPVAPLNFLTSNHHTVLGDVDIPAGTNVVIISRPSATDARHFAAAREFRPRRWLDGAPDGAHDAGVLMPFGSGPRICPGRSLAMLEMRVVLATLYANFDVERVGHAGDVREKYAFTVGPEGLQVRLRRAASSS
jgi:cytochrome P450/nitrite reductase/ring-hydroxylating ferredoxin subunit